MIFPKYRKHFIQRWIKNIFEDILILNLSNGIMRTAINEWRPEKTRSIHSNTFTNECKKLKIDAFWNCIFELDTAMRIVATCSYPKRKLIYTRGKYTISSELQQNSIPIFTPEKLSKCTFSSILLLSAVILAYLP